MIRGVLLDLGGVVYSGESPLPGAMAAIERLQAAGLQLRYLTNTTRKPRAALLAKLRRLGLQASPEQLFMPALAARQYLEANGLGVEPLVHPDLAEDFAGLPSQGPGGRAPAVASGVTLRTYPFGCTRSRAGGTSIAVCAVPPGSGGRYRKRRSRATLSADAVVSWQDASIFHLAVERYAGWPPWVFERRPPICSALALLSRCCRARRRCSEILQQ